jgi:hypothetical protein
MRGEGLSTQVEERDSSVLLLGWDATRLAVVLFGFKFFGLHSYRQNFLLKGKIRFC